MGNFRNRRRMERSGSEDQRIAAGEQHVVDLRIFRDIFQSGSMFSDAVHIVAEQPLPEAETAIGTANFGHQKQGRSYIYADNPEPHS